MEQLIRPQQRFKQLRIGTLSEHTEQLATAGRHFLKVAEHQLLNTMLGTATGSQASNSSVGPERVREISARALN